MAALRCSCEQGTDIWGEVWWVDDRHRWIFFDNGKTSDTYADELRAALGAEKHSNARSLGWQALRMAVLCGGFQSIAPVRWAGHTADG